MVAGVSHNGGGAGVGVGKGGREDFDAIKSVGSLDLPSCRRDSFAEDSCRLSNPPTNPPTNGHAAVDGNNGQRNGSNGEGNGSNGMSKGDSLVERAARRRLLEEKRAAAERALSAALHGVT
ncbi:MAG: hypothetical protein SGPRY_013080, partial [Prymnesium sp.]